MTLVSHPRLYASAAQLARVTNLSGPAFLKKASAQVNADAEEYCRTVLFKYDDTGHNHLLIRARIMQRRIVVLLVRWKATGQDRYRKAALDHVREMAKWKYWSWITLRRKDPRPDAIFDLSYGENSATLAIAYDWLHATLTPGEKALFISLAKKWSFAAFLKADKKASGNFFWFKHPGTNWNTVCAGGAGMLALALYEELPVPCRRVLALVETSIAPFMKSLDATSGGWPEGIGYWGYGMRYAFMYLLSWENAHGRVHPLMKSPNVSRTLDFPLDFMPNNEPLSFGDVNTYWALPFHYAAAVRLKRPDIVETLDKLISACPERMLKDLESWPNLAELLVFHPRKSRASVKPGPRLSAYPGLDWFALRDRWPSPDLCLTLRGGTTEVNHGHIDLTSFQCAVGDETLIHNVCQLVYLDSTFGPRRFEIPEMTPQCKNVLLINGVGVVKPSTVQSRAFEINGLPAVRMEATKALGIMRDFPSASFYARLFVLLGDKGALVIDRITTPHPARIETRLHTFANVRTECCSAVIRGKRRSLGVRYASTQPSLLETGNPVLTDPGRRLNTLKLVTKCLVTEATMAALLVKDDRKSGVTIRQDRKVIIVRTVISGKVLNLRLTEKLNA